MLPGNLLVEEQYQYGFVRRKFSVDSGPITNQIYYVVFVSARIVKMEIYERSLLFIHILSLTNNWITR